MHADASLTNEDLAPVGLDQRTWTRWDIAALWVGMAVCIPTYTMASSLIGNGMNWWQALLTVFLGNLIVLIPMTLNAHPGTAYGIPFPVLLRASFGTRGANIAALLRGVVACGWFGIQTWFGGAALHATLAIIFGFDVTAGAPIAGLGITAAQLICFLFFWADERLLHLERHGVHQVAGETQRAVSVTGRRAADDLGGHQGGRLRSGVRRIHRLTKPTTWVGFGAGAHGDGRILGHALAEHPGLLPLREIPARPDLRPGDRPADRPWRSTRSSASPSPGRPWSSSARPSGIRCRLSAKSAANGCPRWRSIVLAVATLSTNIAANVVSPANDFSNLAPRKISFRAGGMITAFIGILIMPWKLVADPSGYIFTWLIGYSALLGPIAGIMIADYFVLRQKHLDVAAALPDRRHLPLHRAASAWRPSPLSRSPCCRIFPGFLVQTGVIIRRRTRSSPAVYQHAWFVGFGLAFRRSISFSGKSHPHPIQ